MKRYALVSLKNTGVETIERYLPHNYEIIGTVERANPVDDSDYEFCFGPCVVVQGEDDSGWTLHDYVIPRLASGLHTAREIDLSHPAMKEIPE